MWVFWSWPSEVRLQKNSENEIFNNIAFVVDLLKPSLYIQYAKYSHLKLAFWIPFLRPRPFSFSLGFWRVIAWGFWKIVFLHASSLNFYFKFRSKFLTFLFSFFGFRIFGPLFSHFPKGLFLSRFDVKKLVFVFLVATRKLCGQGIQKRETGCHLFFRLLILHLELRVWGAAEETVHRCCGRRARNFNHLYILPFTVNPFRPEGINWDTNQLGHVYFTSSLHSPLSALIYTWIYEVNRVIFFCSIIPLLMSSSSESFLFQTAAEKRKSWTCPASLFLSKGNVKRGRRRRRQ